MSSNVVDKVLKRCRCVSEAERHYQRLKQPIPSMGAVSSAASEAVTISGSIAMPIVGMVGDKIAFAWVIQAVAKSAVIDKRTYAQLGERCNGERCSVVTE